MKKTNLKKLLAIVLCLMMCASVLTLFASADAGTAPTFAKTIYMSSTGVDTNDGLSEAKAVATLVKATELLGENGGEIVILNDVTIDMSSVPVSANVHRIYLADSLSTVYIHGKQKPDGTYPSLLFDTSSTGKAPGVEMAGPIAIYDLGLGTVVKCNLWLSANGYPITIGENVSRVQANGGTINITGGQQDVTNSGMMSTQTTPQVTVFSGVWGTIYGGSLATATPISDGIVVNIIGGGPHTSIYGYRENGQVTGNVTINFYGGTVKTRVISYEKDGVINTLNVYNDCMDDATKATVQGVFAAGGSGTVNNVTGTAPDFWTVSACTITPPAPPTFEDDPALGDDPTLGEDPNAGGEENNATDTKAPETNAPETNAPETEAPAEEKGCGGVIGASALVIAAVVAGAAIVGKKREE